MKAWHFLRDDKTLGYNDKREVKVGEWLEYKHPRSCEIELCQSGMHASENIIDALTYAPGSIICRVELGGKIIKGDDKLVAEKRKVLWMIDGRKILKDFAFACASRAVDNASVSELTDYHVMNLIEFYSGVDIDPAARSAADHAADYAARSDAYYAAYYTAYYAAYYTSYYASRYAARSAAYSDACFAGFIDYAEKKEQEKYLLELIAKEQK